MTQPTFDAQDQAILDRRAWALWDAWDMTCPRVGDFVDFADGVTRRVSHVWDWPAGGETVQTSDGGSWYLGLRYLSFSGGLHPGIPLSTLTITETVRDGAVWFFHHDMHRAANAVYTTIPCAVFACTLASTDRKGA